VGVTRREFVELILGGAAAAACGGSRARTPPPGTIVGTGMQRAHDVIRDGGVPVPKAWWNHRVVIIGAGVAGLAAAWQLRRRGITDVLVLELDDVIGGTARGGTSDVTRYPWGAHYIVAPRREQVELISLLSEMGAIEGHEADGTPIVDEALRCREPEERVLYRGRWYEGLYLEVGSSAEDRRQLAAFRAEIDRWSAWRDAEGRPAFAIPTRRASDAEDVRALDRITFAAWLDARGLVGERLRWLCDYACRDDYALTAATASAWAGLFYFAARQAAPGAEAQTVLTWPDGNAALVAHLSKGVEVETGACARSVREVHGRYVEVIATGKGGPFGIKCDAAIVATPSFVARRIVTRVQPPPVPTGDHGAWTVANVHLRSRPRDRKGAPAAWDNVIYASQSLGYVSATHQAGRDRGRTVWTWYYAHADEDAITVRKQLAGAGQPEWAEACIVDLERAHPDLRDHVERIDVAHWGHGMIRPRVGAAFDPVRIDQRRALGRIHHAHTDQSAIALFEEAFDHGLRAADAAIAYL